MCSAAPSRHARLSPRTGFYRDGCCNTGPEDVGLHVVCAQVTAEFLAFARTQGNDLVTPVPAFGFPGAVARRPLVRVRRNVAASLRRGRRAAGGPRSDERGDARRDPAFGAEAARARLSLTVPDARAALRPVRAARRAPRRGRRRSVTARADRRRCASVRRASIPSTGKSAPGTRASYRSSSGRRAVIGLRLRRRDRRCRRRRDVAPRRRARVRLAVCRSDATARLPSTSSFRAERIVPIPDGIDYDHAAALPIAGGTALQALADEARLAAGQRVLITGAAGGVGHFAVQIAKHLGAHVVGVCSAGNADWVRALGADEVVDYAREDFTRRDDRFDVVFDAAGASSFAAARRVLADTGCYINTRGDAGSRRGHRDERDHRANHVTPARDPVHAEERAGRVAAARAAGRATASCARTSSARSRSRMSRTRSARWRPVTAAARSSFASDLARTSQSKRPTAWVGLLL